MGVLRGLIAVTLIGLVRCQQEDIYRAYSPGQYGGGGGAGGGVYRSTPRLVPVKVRYQPKYINPNSYPTFRQQQGHQQRQRQQSTPTLTRHVRVRPSPYIHQQSGQPLRAVKRVRVVPSGSPYAASLDQPVEFRHTVPAVSTYKVAAAPYAQQSVLAQNPQPYYVPRVAQPQQVHRPVLKVQRAPAKGEEQLEDEYPSDANPQYNFAFDVKDDDLTNYQNRQESRDNGVVKGSYSVVDPDGYVRTVTYEATPKGGFQAKVTREKTDVKIKFPVPTEAPVEEKKAYSPQQYQQPQYQQAYSPQPQQQYAAQGTPQYVSRRFPQQGHRLAPRYQ